MSADETRSQGRRGATSSRRVKILSAGVLDAGLASLATFISGLVAVNLLGDDDRGVYAVYFAAFSLGSVLAHQLVFVPSEVAAVSLPRQQRLRVLPESLRLGMWPALLGALAIGGAAFAMINVGSGELLVPLTITGAATTFVWAPQDHIRRMLHIAGKSWRATLVSAVQLGVTAVSLTVMVALDVPVAWIPFGSLAIANSVSIGAGMALAKAPLRPGPHRLLDSSEIHGSGRWLVIGAGTPMAANLVAAGIITQVAGAEAMGFAEAARVISQPILVLSAGLASVLNPRAMEAAASWNRAAARRPRVAFVALVAGATSVYAVVAGLPWAGNPMRALVPSAYVVDWLVLATIAANGAFVWIGIIVAELTATRRERSVAVVSIAVAPIQILAAATAAHTGAFARPMGIGARGALRGASLSIVLHKTYKNRKSDQP